MTTNIDRAALVMAESAARQFNQDPTVIPYLANRNLPRAEALAAAGLLMPDLPEPVWRPHAEHEFRYRVWPIPFGQVERTPRPGSLIAITDGEEDITTYTSAQACELAYALLAAAATEEA